MKVVFLALSWMLATAGLVISLSAGYNLSQKVEPPVLAAVSESELTSASQITSIPENGSVKGMETSLATADARAQIVANFLERYDSPLKPYDHFGEVFVDIADRYNFDFRLLPAIAMQESNLCKRIPEGSYNCLGFGIHSRGTLAFPDFESNFERAGRELKANYIDEGRTTPETIMAKYTPSSNGSWAESVNQWMAEMKFDDRDKGLSATDSANVMEYAAQPEKKSPSPLEALLAE